MKQVDLICISCPMGCSMKVDMEEKQVIKVQGNNCKRGEIYARKELVNPTRIVTSTIKVIGGKFPRVSVKTKEDIPKDKIFDCVRALKNVEVNAPIHIGDVVLENVTGTKVDMVATSENLNM